MVGIPWSRIAVLVMAVACSTAGAQDSAGTGQATNAALDPAQVTLPSATLPARPPTLPLTAFAKTPFIDDPKLSPDGNRVVARLDQQGKVRLGILHLFEKNRPPTLIEAGKYDLNWYRWAGNDRLLISIGAETVYYGVDLYSTRLVTYDLASDQSRYIGMKAEGLRGDDVLHVADDGSSILLAVARDIWSYPGVYRANLATGEIVKVLAPMAPIFDWYADSSGVVRLGLGYSGRKIKVVYRESESAKFETIAKLKIKDLDGDIDTVRFRAQGDRGVVVTNARTGRFALYEFDWKTFEIGAPIFERPDVDIDDFRLSETGEVEAVFYTDDRQRVAWFQPEMKALQAEVDDALKGRMNWITSASRDRSRFIVWSGTADDPGHYYFYHRPSRTLSRLATPLEVLKDRPLAPVSATTYKARDGLEIPAYLTLPLGREPRNLPLVVLAHGGPHVRDDWSYNPWVQFLANRGYAVLQPNFRGSTGYGKDFMARGFGQWGRGMQDDLIDGVRWLVSEGKVDPRRVCIMGASYGGYAAIMATIRNADVFRCAVSFAGVTDVPDMLRYDGRHMIPARYKRWRDMVQGEGEAEMAEVSPVNHAAEVSIPLLLAHGTDDANVPYRQAKKMVKALKKANKTFEFLEFKGVGHGFDDEADHARFLAAVDTFFAQHNPSE